MHDGLATACVGDAPFGYVGVFRAHVNVGFFHGASLPDPATLLVGAGKNMRHVRLEPGASLDEVALVVDVEPVVDGVVLEVGDEPRDVDDGHPSQPATAG